MSVQPPSWAMGAVALADPTDPHLAPGVHLRVITAAALGPPLRPFVVYRLTGDALLGLMPQMARREMTWINSRGRVLVPPFELREGDPVIGRVHRAPGEHCFAISVATDRPGPLDPILFAERAAAAAAGRRPDPVERPASGIVVSGFVDGPLGPRVVARQHAAPFCVGASELHGVIVEGKGEVIDAQWLVATLPAVEGLRPTRLLDLPLAAAARYVGLADAEQRALDRIGRGTPRRVGLHDHPEAPGPSACDPTTPNDERDRVLALVRELQVPLRRVLDDLSARPGAHALRIPLTDGITNDPDVGVRHVKVNCLKALLAGTADPGVARWLGYQDVDDDPHALAASLVIYLVRGFFAPEPADLSEIEAAQLKATPPLLAPIPAGPLPFEVPALSVDGRPVYDFVVPVVAFPAAPPARPAPPTIGAPLAPADLVSKNEVAPYASTDPLGTFLPDVLPPAARRELVLPLTGLEAPPFIAASRLHEGRFHPLNGAHPRTGRALPIVPARPATATAPGAGHLFDREAPADTVAYLVAQADAFGRWSERVACLVDEKTRPRPPAPSFEVHYTPAPATPGDDPRFGTLRVRIAVPKVETLAAGSRLLDQPTITATIAGQPVAATPAPASPAGFLAFTLTAPADHIARAAKVEATINAFWRDTAGVAGDLGDPRTLTLHDLRPPPPLEVPPNLRYSARPDATGRARAVLTWTAPAGSRHRIYFADETGLRAALTEAAVDDLPAATEANPASRATAWEPHAAHALRAHFTLLTAEPIVAQTTGEQRYAYDLSGSLAVLAFFKVIPVSEGNVESPFTEATLIPFAVPRQGGPTRPLLDFAGWNEPTAGGPLTARLNLTLVRGPQQPVRWRLRRSFATSDDPRAMPIVASGEIPSAPDPSAASAEAPQIIPITDPGTASALAPALRPWTQTSWRIEVQAQTPTAAPGTRAPQGEWSPASAAAHHLYIPPPPTAPAGLAIEAATPTATTLRWTHPDPLPRGGRGGYRFDIYRRPPGQREDRVATVLADDPTVATLTGGARAFRYTDATPAAPGTEWRVVVVDPAGRQSPPSNRVARSATP